MFEMNERLADIPESIMSQAPLTSSRQLNTILRSAASSSQANMILRSGASFALDQHFRCMISELPLEILPVGADSRVEIASR